MYTVQQVAKMMDMSPHTLRFYDNEGLFPYVSRSQGGARLFDDEDLKYVYLVQCLRLTGMPLTEVKHYVDLTTKGEKTLPERYALIVKQQKVAKKELETMQERVAHIEKKAAWYKSLIDGTETVDYWTCVYDKLMEKLANNERKIV
jgi:DNA-binding transcriptional MerR regulator